MRETYSFILTFALLQGREIVSASCLHDQMATVLRKFSQNLALTLINIAINDKNKPQDVFLMAHNGKNCLNLDQRMHQKIEFL